MEAWIKASAVNLAHNIISSANNVFWINNGTLYGGVGGSYMLVSKGSFPTNTWKHVALTFNDSTNTMTLYVDGVQVNQNTGVTQTYASEILRLGSHFAGGNPVSFFNGKIGLARIYNTALTSAQILQNYDAVKSRFA